jgi:hypothetical protein
MMKFGAWIHSNSQPSWQDAILLASQSGLHSIRSYSFEYSAQVAPILGQTGMSLLAGMHVEAEALAADWRSQVRLDELAEYFELGVPLEAICVGNELREGGDAFDKKQFTAALAEGLAYVLDTYHDWMMQHGVSAPLTYANEMISFAPDGSLRPETLPLMQACDILSANHYPMAAAGWMGTAAFLLNEQLLHDTRTQNDQFARFECALRILLQEAEKLDKPLMFSETGFPSAVDWRHSGVFETGKFRYHPIHDTAAYETAMQRFISLIQSVNADYRGRIQALYFYEWQDNLNHPKIWNIEKSPIHIAFGLCDEKGNPKLDIPALIASAGA